MFKTPEEQQILKEHKERELLQLFRKTLNRISNIKMKKLETHIEAKFGEDGFAFDITVFDVVNRGNKTLRIYEFYDLKKSKKYVDDLLCAIRSDDFEKIKLVIDPI